MLVIFQNHIKDPDNFAFELYGTRKHIRCVMKSLDWAEMDAGTPNSDSKSVGEGGLLSTTQSVTIKYDTKSQDLFHHYSARLYYSLLRGL